MKSLEIYIHGENNREPKLVEVAENSTVPDIINRYKQEFHSDAPAEEIEIFIENEQEPVKKDRPSDEIGLKKRGHFHCHRCKKIAVTIIYNGEDKTFQFEPSATGKKILKKAIAAFNINEHDAGDYLLKLDDKTILQASDHIGSYASYPQCSVKLNLTPTKPVQG